jgi:hypothetical protein
MDRFFVAGLVPESLAILEKDAQQDAALVAASKMRRF